MREHAHPASTWILLADVRISERRRQGLSARKVELYRQWLEDGRHAPPVRLARDGGGFVVRDGRHRVAAALAAGHVGIEAVLRRLLGMKLCWRSTSLAPRRGGFDSRRLHSRLRSVNGKHAPFVRPRCGFDSCRRLLHTPVAQRTERCPATAEAAGSSPAGRTTSRT